MGICIHGDCAGCHRYSILDGDPADYHYGSKPHYCQRCRKKGMPHIYFCSHCSDTGSLGFLPRWWLFVNELEDSWLDWLLVRTCPVCNGDPQSVIPPRPRLAEFFDGMAERMAMQQAALEKAMIPPRPAPPKKWVHSVIRECRENGIDVARVELSAYGDDAQKLIDEYAPPPIATLDEARNVFMGAQMAAAAERMRAAHNRDATMIANIVNQKLFEDPAERRQERDAVMKAMDDVFLGTRGTRGTPGRP